MRDMQSRQRSQGEKVERVKKREGDNDWCGLLRR